MPNKRDIYTGLTQMLLQAGVKTVIRGFYDPAGDEKYVDASLPLAALYELEPEAITEHSSQGSYLREGVIALDLFVSVDSPAGTYDALTDPETNAGGWFALDDLEDSILRAFRNQFPDFFSNNVTLTVTKFDQFWMYQWQGKVGGSLRVKWTMGFA